MSSKSFLTAMALVAFTCMPVTAVSAERINENSAKANAEFEKCMDSGSATVEHEGVKSCFYGGGHGIICGGPKPDHKGTCDTFRRDPRKPNRKTKLELARMKAMKASTR